MISKRIFVAFALCAAGLFGRAHPALAWGDTGEPLVDDRVVTLTVREKGWSIGGVAVDRIGSVYVADFAETVWKVTPEGEVIPFATGLYGASGNAVDARGRLFQSNFNADTVSVISRRGEVSTYVDEGLAGPVGIAIDEDGTLYVCNCRSNTVARVSVEREVSELVSLAGLTGCPNGITFGPDKELYVVGFGRPTILKVTLDGEVSRHAEIPGSWLAHLVFAGGQLYVTSFGTHEIYRVDLSGGFEVLAGAREAGIASGTLSEARFSNPNGIAASASGLTLFINNFNADWRPPGRSRPPAPLVLSRIDLVSLSERLVGLMETRGTEAAVAAYRDHKSDPRHAEENTEGTINFLGYWLLRRDRLEHAIAVFELNAESYPESANVWDSLAEGHLASGDRDRAVELYRKSLELNPDNVNAKQKLKSLGAESATNAD